jgi:hypothetical protein
MTGRSSISAYYIACLDQGPDIIGPCIRDLKSEGASGFSKYYIVGKEILDFSTQQQGTESILVNFESLLFVL